MNELQACQECPYCSSYDEHRQHLFELAGGVGDIDNQEEEVDITDTV